MHFHYLLWFGIFVALPIALLWLYDYAYLKNYYKIFRTCIICALLFSVPWDALAVHAHIWNFPKQNVLGIWIFNLPIEEFLFIIFVTVFYATVTLVVRHKLEDVRSKDV